MSPSETAPDAQGRVPGPGPAAPETSQLRIASLLATAALVGAVLVLLFRRELFANQPAGLIVQVAASLLMLWARLTLGMRSFHAGANPTEGGLVTSGPYRFIRHPIYSAILFLVWAAALSHVSIVSIVARVLATAAVAVRIASEERLLLQRYPEYAAYAARTRRVVPFVV